MRRSSRWNACSSWRRPDSTERCGELDISFSKPGGFPLLLEHVYAYAELLAVADPAGRTPSFPVAAAEWYNSVYLPVLTAIRQRHLARRFKGATDADMYVWIVSELIPLADLVQGEVPPAEAVDKLVVDAPATFTRRVLDLLPWITRPALAAASDRSGGQAR